MKRKKAKSTRVRAISTPADTTFEVKIDEDKLRQIMAVKLREFHEIMRGGRKGGTT